MSVPVEPAPRPRFRRLRLWAEPGLRRGFHLYWRFARGMTLGVRGLVIDAADRVFLVKHTYVSGWHLPGGGVEVGETMLEALARELAEEGHIVATTPPILFGIYFNARISRRDHVALFVVRAFEQTQVPVPNSEIIATGFFPPDRLPADTTPGTRARIEEVLQNRRVSPRW